MKQQILDYEKFIKKAAGRPTESLWRYHQEMVGYFQHERLIHLIVTLFFCGLTLVALGGSCWFFIAVGCRWATIPFVIVDLLLVGLSVAYVAHYYFLENHIQKLYQYSQKLARFN